MTRVHVFVVVVLRVLLVLRRRRSCRVAVVGPLSRCFVVRGLIAVVCRMLAVYSEGARSVQAGECRQTLGRDCRRRSVSHSSTLDIVAHTTRGYDGSRVLIAGKQWGFYRPNMVVGA